MVFLSRENRKDIDLHEYNSNWRCIFDGGEIVPGTKLNEGGCQHTHIQVVTCPIPEGLLLSWNVSDPRYQQAQGVSVTAFSMTANVPFRYERIEFCRYPPANEWRPRNVRPAGPTPVDGPKPSPAPGSGRDVTAPVQLAACTMLRHELGRNRDLVLEWLAYHRLQGVEHFYIFSNGDTRALRRLLRPYVEEGAVEVIDWEWNSTSWVHQLPQTNACIYRYRGLARWVALMDVDEYFQAAPAAGGSLRAFVARHDNTTAGALCAPMVLFRGTDPPGAGGTLLKYGNLVTAEFVLRAATALPSRGKCVCRPEGVNIMDVHEYCGGGPAERTDADRELRVNHYKASETIPNYGFLFPNAVERFDTEDRSMLSGTPALRAEILRAFPDWLSASRGSTGTDQS